MHELTVTQNLLELAERYGTEAGATRVTDLYLVIGQLSSFVDESLQFYWDMISEGTLCSGAALHFQRVPAWFACQQCGTEYPLERELECCPACNSPRITLLRGDEFRLESIEIETSQRNEQTE
ncbi:MAG TPA: hydrogenase maturation nickel metallochaperone HypA [Anaerolineales bacterium]|nr:hydrogenase maturation nickel metallochaperone HypA [Anaerolineales bacterium]